MPVVERWIFARLRNHSFFSLGELNAAIGKLLEQLKHRPSKKLERCRRTRLAETRSPRASPAAGPAPNAWKKAKVHPDSPIEVGGKRTLAASAGSKRGSAPRSGLGTAHSSEKVGP